MSVDEAQLAREQRGEVLSTIDVEWTPGEVGSLLKSCASQVEDARETLLEDVDAERYATTTVFEWDVIRAMPEDLFLWLVHSWMARVSGRHLRRVGPDGKPLQ